MDVALFDFDLPDERIALRPANPRDSARLLVVHADGCLEHRRISDLPDILQRGDMMVFNDTKVIPARLRGWRLPREATGQSAKIELLLHKRTAPDTFLVFARPARKLTAGDRLLLGTTLLAHVAKRNDGGEVELVFSRAGTDLDAAIAVEGEVPLPPYIASRRAPDEWDVADYQTMFAEVDGSVAAPTAGLHFTPELVDRLNETGVSRQTITLHVGAGTFLPVVARDTNRHLMHAEWATVSDSTAQVLNAARERGGRILAVGTTSLRTLETASRGNGETVQFAGDTSLFITPGYAFKSARLLLTNFHLPRSTLFMLVCAFSGIDAMKRAYAEAIQKKYRFYSYGDACLLFR